MENAALLVRMGKYGCQQSKLVIVLLRFDGTAIPALDCLNALGVEFGMFTLIVASVKRTNFGEIINVLIFRYAWEVKSLTQLIIVFAQRNMCGMEGSAPLRLATAGRYGLARSVSVRLDKISTEVCAWSALMDKNGTLFAIFVSVKVAIAGMGNIVRKLTNVLAIEYGIHLINNVSVQLNIFGVDMLVCQFLNAGVARFGIFQS